MFLVSGGARRIGLGLLPLAMLLSASALLAVPSASAAVFSSDRVIVEWDASASSSERRAAREGAEVDFTRDLGSRRFQLVATEPGQAPRDAVRELEADPAVVLAERDGYFSPDSIPDDPLFDQLWGLQNTGLGIGGFAGALAGADIDASSAWERTLGTPATVVAVLDSGYRFEHPDLADVVWTNLGETPDGVDDDDNGIVDDVHGADFVGPDAEAPVTDGDPTDDDLLSGGHGIHVAGTIGAEGDNGIGITGVAQNVSLMPLRVCSRMNEENDCPFSAAIEAINYAGEMGARVANMSFGSTTDSAAIENAIAANPQTLFVVSAGNDGMDNDPRSRRPCTVDPPGEGKSAVDNVICVAATDQADKLAGFSNWGAKTVDLGAPGTQTLSTYTRRLVVDEDFELDDFASKWSADGADGGFARTSEAPLTSFGISDSPGATPVAGSVRASTTTPVSMSAGIHNCVLEYDYSLSLSPGGRFGWEARLDGSLAVDLFVDNPGQYNARHEAVVLGDALSDGGEVDIRFRYDAGPDPSPGDGVWVDNIVLRCPAGLGEADGYAFLNGTSMAAPHVTGATALLFSLKPSASVTEVRQGLLESVDRISSLTGKTVTGGRLDTGAAVDLFDAVPPPTPTLSATNPPSPSGNAQPRLKGLAQPGASVDVYANASCSGSPVAAGTAAQLAAPGIAVPVVDGTVTELTTRATDLAPLTSTCSAPISYTHLKAAPDPGGGDGGPTPGGGDGAPKPDPGRGDGGPTPGAVCIVPKLAGKKPAQAKAALTAAACKLGTVRKPRPRKGKPLPPLVVKSSTPAPGARPADGKVDLRLGPKSRKGAPLGRRTVDYR
ncbi:MAG TPA: S8 family serine peptidase [Solirubrobacterales bacterium]|nr:S8 family serine peptidase [Solirubrobacterales bacterium]